MWECDLCNHSKWLPLYLIFQTNRICSSASMKIQAWKHSHSHLALCSDLLSTRKADTCDCKMMRMHGSLVNSKELFRFPRMGCSAEFSRVFIMFLYSRPVNFYQLYCFNFIVTEKLFWMTNYTVVTDIIIRIESRYFRFTFLKKSYRRLIIRY